MRINSFPKRIIVELSLDCNLSCDVCPRKYIENKKGFMGRDLWEKIIKDVSNDSSDSIIIPFWRGESLLHPDFIEFIEFALNKTPKLHFSTNGVIFDDKIAQILSRFDFVTFSVHNVLGYENAKKFLLFKNDKNFPVVQVSFVTGEKVIKNIYDNLIKSKDLGGFNSVRLYEAHTLSGVFGRSSQALGANREFCPKLQDTLVIAFDGSVSRCNHIWQTEENLSIVKSSIKDIWNSQRLDEIRNAYPDDKCLFCDQWHGHTRGESFRLENNKILHSIFN